MITLGIDPGTASLGYGIVEECDDGQIRALACGVIRTHPRQPMPERLLQIHSELLQVIHEYQPQRAGVEELFFARNVSNALTVAQARGVVLLTLQQAQLPIAEYKPNSIKQAICGYGGADKAQMKEMTRLLLNLPQPPRDDAADALAVALTDLRSVRWQSLPSA